MATYIGSVTFRYRLKWLDKSSPFMMGSDVRTRSGDVVSIRAASPGPSQNYRFAKLRFEWESFANVELLRAMWKSGNAYFADFEDNGDVYAIRFAAKDGVANVKHQAWGDDVVHAAMQNNVGVSYPTDLYTGELNVIIVGSGVEEGSGGGGGEGIGYYGVWTTTTTTTSTTSTTTTSTTSTTTTSSTTTVP